MASLGFSALILWIFPAIFLISYSQSLTCTSQKFTNKLYAHCSDLSQLSSYLHWTYSSSDSSLSVAFVAPPAKSNGWIAWAINPSGIGMVGAQALIAYRDSNGSVTVETYNISSYTSIVKSNLSFHVTEMSADYSNGMMRIFATVKLPEEALTVNHVWQVGSSAVDGFPSKHGFQPANLNSKGTLDLSQEQSSFVRSEESRTRKENVQFLYLVRFKLLLSVFYRGI